MNGPRAWITLLAGTSFLAGLAAGLLVAAVQADESGLEGDFAGYRQRVVRQLELNPERSELLAAVLVNYEQDLARVRDQQTARSMETMEPELRELGGRGLLGEADLGEVRAVHLHQQPGLGRDRSRVVTDARAVGRSDLDQARAGHGHHVGDAEGAADLDQLAARDRDFLVEGERVEHQQPVSYTHLTLPTKA